MYNFIIYALYEQVRIRKPAKRCLFLIPNLRTAESIEKQKKPTCVVGLNSWQGNSRNSRVDEMHDLLMFGQNVKVFIDKQINFEL